MLGMRLSARADYALRAAVELAATSGEHTTAEQLALAPPNVPAGLPSSLLERRPDVRSAENQLAAATARIGVAKADYFPRVFLTGAAGGGGVRIDGSWFGPQGIGTIAPQLTLPIFNMGRVGAGVDSAEARALEALASYEQTVQTAFREVSDALVQKMSA